MNLKIANYFGIPLYLNLLVFPFIFFVYFTTKDGLGAFAVAIYIFGLFFVVLHEYGHCFMARKFKWQVQDITIYPLGGAARINFKHTDPKQEIFVALAGPAVNFGLICVFLPLFILFVYLENFNLCFVFLVMVISNLLILVFNLFICVFPMDGGRVLRALLSCKIGHERATWWAVRLGQGGGFILAVLALYFGFWLVAFIFVLMIMFSQDELTEARMLAALYRIRIKLVGLLNKPELAEADLPELIQAVETSQNEKLKKDTLLLLKDLNQSNVSI